MSLHFSVTDSAFDRLRALLAKKAEGSYLRVKVEGGGCSGLQYLLSFDAAPPEEGEHVIEGEHAKVVVDAESAEFLKGASLEYSSAIGDAAFKVVNPNAKTSCGCGSSFSV